MLRLATLVGPNLWVFYLRKEVDYSLWNAVLKKGMRWWIMATKWVTVTLSWTCGCITVEFYGTMAWFKCIELQVMLYPTIQNPHGESRNFKEDSYFKSKVTVYVHSNSPAAMSFAAFHLILCRCHYSHSDPWLWPPLWACGQNSGYRSRGACSDSRRYQIFWEVVGLEWGPLSLMRITEELLEWKVVPLVWKSRLTAVGTHCADHATSLYPQKLALTSPISGGRTVGIVHLWTKSHGVHLFLFDA
jgi:hypothetical protein